MEPSADLKQKVANYHPSATVSEVLNGAHILLLVAISGGGKDTIKERLLQTGNYHHIISYTTRPPRENHGAIEQDGVDYHFIDLTTSENMLEHGEYVEADIYANQVYGTGIADIRQAEADGKIAVTDMTVEGAAHYLELAPSVKAVFLLPPSYAVWMQRLSGRSGGKQTDQDLRLRLEEAVGELEQAMASEQMYIVVNDNLEETIQLVDDIAHDQPVEPHYHKAMAIAQHLVDELHTELAKLQ